MASETVESSLLCDREILEFLTEFAKYLVAAGVSNSRFTTISQLAYVRAATESARFRNSRINQSSVAAITGLSRTLVRVLLKSKSDYARRKPSTVDRVVLGWSSHPTFSTASGKPRRLRISGDGCTFATLARKFGGDVPPRALLRELERKRTVGVADGYVKLLADPRRNQRVHNLQSLALGLAGIVQQPPNSVDDRRGLRVTSIGVDYPSHSALGRVIMQRRLTTGLEAYAKDIEGAGNAIALEAPAKIRTTKGLARTRILVVSHD
jgi:hypothetical protein